jgi:hypothetical protein
MSDLQSIRLFRQRASLMPTHAWRLPVQIIYKPARIDGRVKKTAFLQTLMQQE